LSEGSFSLKAMNNRRFPPPWTVERLPGGFKVIDANENDNDANTAGVLTMDEARPPRRALPIRLVLEGSDPAFIESKQKYLPRTWWR
jgi:hypothetical protein